LNKIYKFCTAFIGKKDFGTVTIELKGGKSNEND